jgi:hypothetical protein
MPEVQGDIAPPTVAEQKPEDASTGADKVASPNLPDDLAGKASSADPERVQLGGVYGTLTTMPTGDVHDRLHILHERIEALRGSASIADLEKRMRASDGRCAPVYLTIDDDGEILGCLAGVDVLAAAMNMDAENVSVILIAQGDADAAQPHLAGRGSGRT